MRARTAKHRGGRPSKYSLAVAARICRAVRKGCSRDAAASLAGITSATLYSWQNWFPEFLDRLQKADSRFEAECVSNIRRAGRSRRNWTASAWLLERKFPHRYAKTDRHIIEKRGRPLPTAFVEGVRRALGMTGKFVPLIGPTAAGLPAGEDIDADVEILPN